MALPEDNSKFLFNTGDSVDSILNAHQSKNRSDHLDLRLGTPNTGLYSWALVKGKLPEVGERLLAVQTPVHDYKKTVGTGPTALPVNKARIVKAAPGKVSFELDQGGAPARYTLIQSSKNKKDWIMIRSKGGNKVVSTVNLEQDALPSPQKTQDPAAS